MEGFLFHIRCGATIDRCIDVSLLEPRATSIRDALNFPLN